MSTVDLIQTALITGGSSGIGKELAKFLISRGKKVIIAGRTEKKLAEVAKEIGAAAYYVLDVGDTKSIPGFVKKITSEHSDLNCVFNNAGVQRPFEFPGSGGTDYDFDLAKADVEIDTNIRGPMHLIVALLPHFTQSSAQQKAVIVNVTSVLGYVPSSIINPVYNGTKAWLHSFTVNLRTQFAKGDAKDKLKVVEVVPPQVATDLHRERKDPDDNKPEKSKATMTLEDFMKDVIKGLDAGTDQFGAGSAADVVKTWQEGLGASYEKMTS